MDRDRTRRGLLAALLGGGVGWLSTSSLSSFPDRFAPLSGDVWGSADDSLPGEVDSPHGAATVRYDDRRVPHVTAGDERALYYAVGYVQAADRLFQMDVLRRLMAGRLAEVVGDVAVPSDVFHRKLQFRRAAEATWERLEGTDAGAATAAFADGVEAYRRSAGRPLECRLLSYDPLEWTPVDTLLLEKQIAWTLTGGFGTLRRAALREAFDDRTVAQLYPRRLDHDAPILRGEDAAAATGDDRSGVLATGRADADAGGASLPGGNRKPDALAPDRRLVSWLSAFESPDGVGSNSWVVGGEHTASGDPILANDPHLRLTAPPVWYEQHTTLDGEYDARGVTFPGVPFVIIGENEAGAWGFTNSGVDVIDFYAYDRPGAGEYRYGDEVRAFDTRTETVAVDGGADREVTVRTSVHGPVVGTASDGDPLPAVEDPVGVAWVGFSATRTTESIHALLRSTGPEDVRRAVRTFDEPSQNLAYAGDGSVAYFLTGAIPLRRTDDAVVDGTRVFDGSAREGEWPGYEPFGASDWDGEGFVPFEAKPHVVDPPSGYLATANQRIVDDPGVYLAERYSEPFRGARIYERLDRRVGSEKPVDPSFVESLQGDVYDRRADLLVPVVESARDRLSGGAAEAADAVTSWDRRMRPDSRGALVFRYWLEAFREATFDAAFEAAGVGELPRPGDWVLGHLPADSRWFAPPGETDGDRAAVAADAMETAVDRIEEAGHEVYGDYNRTDVDHPFDQPFLNYPKLPVAGSPATVSNYRKEARVGSSWRMVSPTGGDSRAILPGGNSGRYFSAQYDDQFEAWVDGEYRPLDRERPADPTRVVRFRGGSG